MYFQMRAFIFTRAIAVAFASSVVKLSVNTDHLESCLLGTKLTFVAKADGKSFFVDSYSKRTWNEASTLCKSAEMSLASVTSEAQFVALNSAVITEFSDSYGYWTSGRDTHEPSQFGWSGTTNKAIFDSYLPFKPNNNVDHQTCVLFYKFVNGRSYFTYDICSSKHYTLCEK